MARPSRTGQSYRGYHGVSGADSSYCFLLASMDSWVWMDHVMDSLMGSILIMDILEVSILAWIGLRLGCVISRSREIDCIVHVSIPCIVGSCFSLYYFFHYLVLSLLFPPPPGIPTDDQLSDEPVFDPEASYALDDAPPEE